MPFTKKFELLLHVPESYEPAGHMPDNWVKNLSDAGELIKDKLDETFPDDAAFIRKLVNPASDEYASYVNPAFISKGERSPDNIRNTRQTNLAQTFLKWKENVGKAFATVDGVVAKFFKDRVAAAKDRWASKVAKGVLRFTGDKVRGRSVAPITAFYLSGDTRAKIWVGPADTADGEPYDIARLRQRNALKAAILQRLVQGGMMIANSGNSASEILAQNGLNADLLNGMRDTAKCDIFVTTTGADKCFCLWELDVEGRINLHVQVGITV